MTLRPALLCLVALVAGCAGRPIGEADATPPAPAVGGAGPVAPAPVDLSGGVDLVALQGLAFRDNPKLVAARSRWQATIEKYDIATGLPDPSVGYSYFVEPIETRTGPQRQRVMFRQPIPFPWKLMLQGRIVEAEARVAHAEFEIATRDLLVDLTDAYHELWYLDRSAETTTEHQDLLRRIVAHATAEHAAGRARFAEVERAQAQLAQLDYDLITIADLRAVQVARLNAILSREPTGAIGPTGPVPAPGGVAVDLATLYREAAVHLQELERDAARIERADRAVDLARSEWLPDFSLGFTWVDTGPPIDALARTPDAEKDAWSLDFGVTLPIWYPKNSARIRKALAERRAAEAGREASLDDATARIASGYYRMTSAARLVRLYVENLLPQASHALATARETYAAGSSSYSHVLELEQVELNYRLAVLRSVADYYQAHARLERSVGRPLPEVVETIAETLP